MARKVLNVPGGGGVVGWEVGSTSLVLIFNHFFTSPKTKEEKGIIFVGMKVSTQFSPRFKAWQKVTFIQIGFSWCCYFRG